MRSKGEEKVKSSFLTREFLIVSTLLTILGAVIFIGILQDQQLKEKMTQKAQLINEKVEKEQNEIALRESLPEITCWGDGLTTGNHSDGLSYPDVLAELINLPVHNMGVNLEDSATIATRQGGRFVWLKDFVIPSTITPVKVSTLKSLITNELEVIHLLVNGDSGINPVSIAGIEGTLTLSDENPRTYYFTRLEEGKEVEIEENTPLLTWASEQRRNDITIIFIGQNGGYGSIDQLINQQLAMIEHLGHDKYIVLGLTTGTAESRATLEGRLEEVHGEKFINLRHYLSSEGLIDADIKPTQEDFDDMERGIVPNSLRLDDSIIGNSIYHQLIAKQIFNKILELNYLTEEQVEYLGLSSKTHNED